MKTEIFGTPAFSEHLENGEIYLTSNDGNLHAWIVSSFKDDARHFSVLLNPEIVAGPHAENIVKTGRAELVLKLSDPVIRPRFEGVTPFGRKPPPLGAFLVGADSQQIFCAERGNMYGVSVGDGTFSSPNNSALVFRSWEIVVPDPTSNSYRTVIAFDPPPVP